MGLRDILLLALVAVLCLVAFANRRFGLFGYLWFGLMRPDMLAWSGPNRYSLALAVSAVLSSITQWPQGILALLRNSIAVGMMILFFLFTLSAVFAVQPELAMDALWQALRVLVMALMIPLLLRTRKDLRTLMLVIGVSLGLLGSKFGLFGIWHGGVRFALGYGGMLSDNNSLALGLAMGMPFMWFGRDLVSRLWLKAALLAMFAFSSAAVVMTYSRGGAVAMAVGLLAIVWRSRHKLLVLVGLVIISIPTLVFVGSKYLDRLSTLKAPTEEASAYSRVVLAKAGLQLWMDYPILGVGFGQQNEQVLINRYLDEGYKGHGMKVLHNTYVQLLSDCGVFAFILFCGLLFGTLIWLNGVIKRARDQQDMIGPCASALQSSLVAYAVGATTLSRAEWDLIYIELAVAALILRILKEDLEEASSPIPAPEMISEGFSYPAPAPRQNWK